MSKWIRAAKPTYTGGRIVLHSDDGRLPDYVYYFQIIKRQITRYNQFNPSKSGIFCPDVNSGYVDSGWHETVGLPMMTWDMLRDIQESGGEILSHCKYHIFLNGARISQPLASGATRIDYTDSQTRPREGKKFYITEGSKRDNYTVVSYEHVDSGSGNHMIITPALTNSYTTAARIYVHPDFLPELLQGNKDIAADNGVSIKSHVNPWYSNSAESLVFLKMYMDSVVTTSSVRTIADPADIDIYDIKRTDDIRNWTFEQVDTLINNVKNADGIAFVQMHGVFGNKKMRDNLEYLVGQAMLRGVRIITHSEAIEYIKSKQEP